MSDPERVRRVYRRTLWVVVLSQILGGAGLAAGVTVGALIARDLLGNEGLSGMPTALFTLGSAFAALWVGRLSQRRGRRVGLASGFLTGALGAIGVIVATATEQVVWLFFALFVYGAGTATNLQARYAGTDLAGAHERAKAVSVALVSTTFGAVAGPNLVEPTGRVALSLGLPELSGPFLLALFAYGLAGVTLLVGLRPDPLLLSQALRRHDETTSGTETPSEQEDRFGLFLGALIMVVSQLVMVAVMTMTPIHMRHHGHELGAIGLVIGAHIGAMYFPSLVTGVLVERFGREWMGIACGVTLFTAGTVAAWAPNDSLGWLLLALVLLGVGWNFGLISGTALLVDATTVETRARRQGSVDVLVAFAGASGGIFSGLVAAQLGFVNLSLIAALVSLVIIFAMWRYRTLKHRLETGKRCEEGIERE